MPNPFFYGGYITIPDYFVGRRAELRTIFALLETAHTGQMQSVSVVGPRRIGKSSLLFHVMQVYRMRLRPTGAYRVAYVDATDPRCMTQAGFLDYVLDELSVAHETPVTLASFTTTIERNHPRLGLVVCLDEFESLTKNRAEFPDAFFDGLRSLMSASHIAFVIAAHISLAQLKRDDKWTSPFFTIIRHLELGELTDAEADELADRGYTSDQRFTPKERQWLRQVGGRHPMKLQIAGSLLYDAKVQGSVNWHALKRDYRQQIESVFGKQRARWLTLGVHVVVWVWRILCSPRYLGRAILDLLGRGEKASEVSAWLIGVALICVMGLVLYGIVGLKDIVELFTGTKK